MSNAETPERVGACWDALIDAQVSFERDVWLSTYDAATIRRVAIERQRAIGGVVGYVLRPSELNALLNLPAGE